MRWESIKDVFKREHEISPNQPSFNSTQDMSIIVSRSSTLEALKLYNKYKFGE